MCRTVQGTTLPSLLLLFQMISECTVAVKAADRFEGIAAGGRRVCSTDRPSIDNTID